MLELLGTILICAGTWRYFQKMGRQGWEGIIPFYNSYVLFEELYGNGWRFLLFLIPLYNIYLAFRVGIDLARAFHQSTGFGVGLTLLPIVFVPMLGFGSAVYGDGSQAAPSEDPISRVLDDVTEKVSAAGTEPKPRRDEQAMEKLKDLAALHEAGVLTDEEFEQKKKELLERL